MKRYFQRCFAEAVECEFKCPTCDNDLSEYMLLRKVMVGLSNPVLKREIFQGYSSYNSVEVLRNKCMLFEAAVRDAGVLCRTSGQAVVGTAAEAAAVGDDVTGESEVAAARPGHPSRMHCGNCGMSQ